MSIRHLICMLAIVGLAACATGGGSASGNKTIRDHRVDQEQLRTFTRGRPAAFHDYYATILKQGERNAVLNFLRLGLELLKHGEFTHAGDAFDQAIGRIETIYADNDQARKARSKFTPEYVKDFKGDPYERAMAYFYRGLVFLEQDDYENARAAMLGGLEQDAMAEEDGYAKDFALLYFLAGWASQCNGDDDFADELFDQAARINSELRRPHPAANLLYLAFVNSGPVKKRAGEHDEMLYYERSWPSDRTEATRDHSLALISRDRPVDLIPGEDLYFQAATRGGRAVDVINAGKAEFKENTEAASNFLTSAGMSTMLAAQQSSGSYNRRMGNIGAGLALLGVVSRIASNRTKPEADIRYWDNLPEFVYVGTSIKQPDDEFLSAEDLRVTVFDAKGQPVDDYINAIPHSYFNLVRHDQGCDWIGIEPYKRPLPTTHINR